MYSLMFTCIWYTYKSNCFKNIHLTVFPSHQVQTTTLLIVLLGTSQPHAPASSASCRSYLTLTAPKTPGFFDKTPRLVHFLRSSCLCSLSLFPGHCLHMGLHSVFQSQVRFYFLRRDFSLLQTRFLTVVQTSTESSEFLFKMQIPCFHSKAAESTIEGRGERRREKSSEL